MPEPPAGKKAACRNVPTRKKAMCPNIPNTFLNFSRDETTFQINNASFVELIAGIEVRIYKNYVSFEEYYIRNWENCATMWAFCYRKDLVVLGDNTSNRVERTFWTMRAAIADKFSTLPSPAKANKHLIEYTDLRLTKSYHVASTKSLRIFDKNSSIYELNKQASLELNERGCIMFHKSQKALEARKEEMCIVENKVHEEYVDNVKAYDTTLQTCNCKYHVDNQIPCRHFLLLRYDQLDVEVFTKELFHERYWRNKGIDMQSEYD